MSDSVTRALRWTIVVLVLGPLIATRTLRALGVGLRAEPGA
jgi:hypothetical protein